jgi:hypothetical protein
VAGYCLVTDASRDGGVVHRLAVGTTKMEPFAVDRMTGLPPRHIGVY